jgi:hypothetical protein
MYKILINIIHIYKTSQEYSNSDMAPIITTYEGVSIKPCAFSSFAADGAK